MRLNAKKRCLRRHQTDIRAGSATGALTSIKRKNQPNTSSTQTRYENDDQTRPSEAAQIKFSPCFLANCCKGGHYVCMWCFMQENHNGQGFRQGGAMSEIAAQANICERNNMSRARDNCQIDAALRAAQVSLFLWMSQKARLLLPKRLPRRESSGSQMRSGNSMH